MTESPQRSNKEKADLLEGFARGIQRHIDDLGHLKNSLLEEYEIAGENLPYSSVVSVINGYIKSAEWDIAHSLRKSEELREEAKIAE